MAPAAWPPPSPSAPIAVAPAPIAAAPVAPEPTCVAPAILDTIDDGDGVPTPTGSMALGDVQVVANDETIAVAWTRQSNYMYGDSWRSPHFAERSTTDPGWRTETMPAFSFACALYGTGGVDTLAHPFVSWGVANNHAFEVFGDVPKLVPTGKGVPAHSRPLAEIATPKQTVDHVVASRDVSLAVLSEDLCEVSCTCSDGHRNMALWLRSLDRIKPWSERVSRIYEREDDLGAPAIAMGDTGGIVAYRVKSALHLAWLDAEGKLLGKGAPVTFDSGDVGAPAVAMAGNDAIVVWARRAAKDEPYALMSMRLGHGASPISPTPIPTSNSAFAPSVIADGKSVTVAWMEGDGGRHGRIHVARGLTGRGVVVSGDETNARDPELSGTPEHPVIVWQSFPEHRRAGVIRVGRLDCSR